MQSFKPLSAIESDRDIPLTSIPAFLRPKEPQTASNHVVIDGSPTVPADLIRIDVKASDFNRIRTMDETFCDPHPDFLFTLLNSYLSRIRTVTRSPTIRLLDPQSVPWKIEYLDDSRSELPSTETLVRQRACWNQKLTLSAIPPNCWDPIRDLPPLFVPARYDVLILDAYAALPDTGAAVVLSFAALETLIAAALKRLASTSTTVPERLWEWINDRGDWRKEPSVAEQFDVLLQVLCSKSLKDDPRLWDGFKNLKGARDSFVHEGVAAIGKSRVEVTGGQARDLVNLADDIIQYVEALLPLESRMPRYRGNVDIKMDLRKV
jgi:hypothetical protein